MGHSVNSRSPDTPNWSFPRAVLGKRDIDYARQVQEMWKAALSDRGGQLVAELSNPVIAGFCRAAAKFTNPVEASAIHDRTTSRERKASLVLDISKRALVRSVANRTGTRGFAAELFSEVTSYYASRDLPSFIGAEGRIGSPRDSIELKSKLRQTVKGVADSTPLTTTSKGWHKYVNEVIRSLTSSK